MNNIQDIIGKKVIALRGTKLDHRGTEVPVQYIMFDDGESYLELQEQDYYTYHDCDTMARQIYLQKDKKLWKLIMSDKPDENGNYYCFNSTEKYSFISM